MRIQIICPCGQAHTLDLEKDTKFTTGAGNACGIEEKPQPQDGGGYESCPTEAQDWKMNARRHDLQIEAGRLREEVKREKNLNRAYQENTQKLRHELNDEIARRNCALEDGAKCHARLIAVENEKSQMILCLNDERKRKEQVMATCEGLRNKMQGFKDREPELQKLRASLADEIARRERAEETSKGLSVQVRDLENERTVLTFALSEKQKKLDEARREVKQPAKYQEEVDRLKGAIVGMRERLERERTVSGARYDENLKLQQKIKDLECQLRAETEQRRGLEIKCQELRSRPQTTTQVNEAQAERSLHFQKLSESLKAQLDESRAEINRLVNEPPKSKDAETIYDLRIELSQAQRQLTKIRSIANEMEKQP